MVPSTSPPLEKIIHLLFMYHETCAFALRGNVEKAGLLRQEEETLYQGHGISREQVQQYAAVYNRDAVLTFFRTNPEYLELEKAFARAPDEKFNVLRRVTSFTSATRIESKHMRTIPVADYARVTAELNLLARQQRHG
jgi:N-dimethylarginine dimethylaminohydrolase